jgi:lysophospholipase L1-like esterase
MTIRNSVKTILCFGDSNTWGANPKNGSRYPRNIRWPSALQKSLGKNYEVISEGLCGRTLVVTDPAKPHRTGITHLRAFLDSNDPLDLVVIMLGTNDIKSMYGLNAKDIARDLEQTIRLIRDKKIGLQKQPAILIVCPPSPTNPKSGHIDPRMARWPKIFSVLPSLYEKMAKKYRCAYIKAGDYISSSAIDGYHLDPKSHLILARTIAEKIRKMRL